MTVRRILLLTVLAAMAAGACQGDTEPRRSPAPTTTSATEADAAVDDATVDEVLAALDQVQGDVLRRIVERGAVGHGDLGPLAAIFLEPERSAQLEVFAGIGDRLDEVRRPPGDNRTTVVRLLTARTDCIYAEVTVDVSATVASPPPPFTSFVVLRPLPAGADPGNVNPTGYAIAAKHRAPADPCG